ncbi:hypothetical protein GIW81_10250 [Hyphomicrobium sp. xq]|uniref:Uncharacterized protein n=1 Tax=Hyphomicrobium album TaxID=2665159 RepID=A0A6I3KLS4_9HYPH|nr:hypothetical protein [Hyphomicrobium album]MTD94712.1 hypothetical protein [Hyphomicrobium album]
MSSEDDGAAAPYHRLGPSILAANNFLHAPAAEAEPPFLEAVPLAQPTPLKVWRVVP